MLIVCEHMHAKHAKTRGVWGQAPPENFENVHSPRLNLRAFSPSKHAYILLSNFYIKSVTQVIVHTSKIHKKG